MLLDKWDIGQLNWILDNLNLHDNQKVLDATTENIECVLSEILGSVEFNNIPAKKYENFDIVIKSLAKQYI